MPFELICPSSTSTTTRTFLAACPSSSPSFVLVQPLVSSPRQLPQLSHCLVSRSFSSFIHSFNHVHHKDQQTENENEKKALLSGSLPSFFDVIENFDAKQTKLSTWVHEYRNSFPSNKIVFYGDDTWLNVLGTSLFDRYEGTSSFFVSVCVSSFFPFHFAS